jgi:sodium/proline symporter
MSDPWLLISFGLYLAAIGVIAIAAWRHTRGLDDFILGGRRLGPWVAALSAGASDMSGWLLLGLPGFAYTAGMESAWLGLGLALGTWINWRLLAPRLRALSEAAGNALTIPEYLHRRFGERGHALPLVSALIILLFFLIYTASGLVAAGKLFETVLGIPYLYAVSLGLFTILLYTMAGGFLAVSWTDALQAGLMFAALLVVPLLGLLHDGLQQPALPAGYWHMLSDATGQPLGWIAILSLLGWGLGYLGQPHILARFKAVRLHGDIHRARRIGTTWVIAALIGATVVGLTGRLWFPSNLPGGDAEKIFLVMTGELLTPLLAGLVLAAVLAAIMSTADSQLLVASTALSKDLVGQLNPALPASTLLRLGRVAVALLGLSAWWIASDPNSQVLVLVAYAWAGFGASFGPVLLLSLYWPRMNASGALAGILAGGLTVILWRNLSGGLFDLYELVPGFAAGLLAAIATTLLSRAPSAEVLALFQRGIAHRVTD